MGTIRSYNKLVIIHLAISSDKKDSLSVNVKAMQGALKDEY